LPPRGRIAGSKGAPVSNPATGTGPPFFPLRSPARARIAVRPRGGRAAGNPGAPARNPNVVVVYGTIPGPVRSSLPNWRGGRVTVRPPSAPAAPPPPPAAGPPFYPLNHPAAAPRPQPQFGAGLIYTSAITVPASGQGSGVYTLFSQQPTGSSIAGDTSAYTLGVQFSVSQAGSLTAVWFYSASGAGALPSTIALFTVAGGTLVHSEAASWSGAAGSGWIRAAFTAPALLTAATAYKACVLTPSGANWYSATSLYWSSGAGAGGTTSGPLSAPNNAGASPGQDSFNAGASLTYPAGTFNAANYWVDPEFTVPGTFTPAAAEYGTGRVFFSSGAPVQNPAPPVAGPPFRQATTPARITPSLPPRGRTSANPGGPVRNPAPGPVFRQATHPAQARIPNRPRGGRVMSNRGIFTGVQAVLGAMPGAVRAALPVVQRGRASANPGGPVQNPPPVIAGPPFFPFRSPVRVHPVLPPRGRVTSNPGAPARNPVAGPAFRQAVRPAQARFPLPPRGRTASNPGGPVQNPPPPIFGPVFRQAASPARIRPALPSRGRVVSNAGTAVRNPHAGPAAYPLHGPVRAPVPQVFSKGRVAANPGAPLVIPVTGAPVYPLHAPVVARRPLPPHGRCVTGNPGAPVRNPQHGQPFRSLPWPARTRILQNAPRGRASSNPGGPVANIPVATLLFRLGSPYFQWESGTPGLTSEWSTGTPVFSWAAGVPETSA
jgi:hypothetical protein